MDNNDILRRLRYTFDLGDDQMIDIFALADATVTRAQVSSWLKKDDDEDFDSIYDKDLATFLNGFITLRRGKKDGEQPKPEKTLTNNHILRKLRIALDLKDDEMIEVFKLAKLKIGKHELSALFRKETHQKYRVCKDQFLRNFLFGLQLAVRG